MKILVLDNLKKQLTKGKSQMSPAVATKVSQEIELLESINSDGQHSLAAYLKNQNGKKMKGSEHVYKYRLTDGDRILYTYGKYLDYIRDKDKDSVVIISYSKHDDQGDIKIPSKQDYRSGEDFVKNFSDYDITAQDLADMQIDDLSIFEEIFSENFTNSHTIFVLSSQEYADIDPDTIDVYLSDEQAVYIDDYMEKQQPLLVLGGAGTGKTVMATHILANYKMQNENTHCAYFTQSRELLRKIEKQYKYISHTNRAEADKSGVDKDTLFLNINDYCRKKLGLLEKDFIKTDQFLDYIKNNPNASTTLERYHIEPLDLWAEIRGTIKGALDAHWNRVTPKNRLDYKGAIIKELDRAGLLIWEPHNKKLFTVDPSMNETLELSPETSAVYRTLTEYFKSVDCSEPLITQDEYKNKSPELSTLSVEHRDIAYKLCQEYQDWLDKEGKYDENDLIRKMLSENNPSNSKALYDMVVVDEIQDYTELQIYLLHKLVRDDRYLIMAGDGHQNVNPTVFSNRRLHSLVNGKLMEKTLQKNFRCQRKIIECANALSTIRNSYIAKGKGDRYEYSEIDGEVPVMLNYTTENEEHLLTTLVEYPNTAILVPTDNDKTRLNKIIKKQFENAPDNVFTVAEIKGMEYRYVVCYNLINCYKELWHQILNENAARKETRYRYYFNLFYVGITRCKEFLCFFEQDIDNPFWEKLEQEMGYPIRQIEVFDKGSLHISELNKDNEELLKQAQQYEDAGQYENALQWYRRAEADEEIIKRCEIKCAQENRNYTKAIRLSMELEDRNTVINLLPEIDSNSELAQLAKIWTDAASFNSANSFSKDSLTLLIKKAFPKEDQEKIQRLFIKLLDDNVENIITNILVR